MKKNRFTIGRSDENDIVLADPSVSRRHAELAVLDNGRLFLTDCRSANGSRILRGGTPVEVRQEMLAWNDTLQFGDVTLAVREIAAALSAAGLSNMAPGGPGAGPDEEKPPPVPWVRGDRLVRCPCGAVRRKDERCRECGE